MKKVIIMIAVIVSIVFILTIIVSINRNRKFDVNELISKYDLSNYKKENEYIDYLKATIFPTKLRGFIDNDLIPMDLLGDNDTGNDAVELIKFQGYKLLFISMFDKERSNFDDCPVTDNFKQKFNNNLIKYYKLIESEDCESNCWLNQLEKELIVEVYGNFKNTEPTYWTTHHFHYTLDEEGNVDDVTFDYTEEK